MRAHLVRRSIENLRHLGAITQYVPINTCALGFSEYHAFLSGTGYFTSQMSKVIHRVLKHDKVPLVSEHAGQLQFGVWVKHGEDPGDVLDEIIPDLPVGVSKTVVMRRAFHAFGAVLGKRRPTPEYSLIPSPEVVPLDELDHKILRAVCVKNSVSSSELGRAVGVPSSTAEYRVKRFQREGVILDPRYLVLEQKLGFQRFYVRLKVRTPAVVRRRLIDLGCRLDAIILLTEVLGSWDFELCVVLRTVAETNMLLAQIVETLGEQYVDIGVFPHLDFLKIQNYPFERYPFARVKSAK